MYKRESERERERERDGGERERESNRTTVLLSGGLKLTSRPTESPIADGGPMRPGGFARLLCPAEEDIEREREGEGEGEGERERAPL